MNEESYGELAGWLEKIAAGEESLESLAAARPDLAALVETAAFVQSASAIAPADSFRTAARVRILNRVQARTRAGEGPAAGKRPGRFVPELRRVFFGLAVAVGLLVAGVLGSIPMQNALPGDALYGGKLALENMQLLTASASEDVILQTRFASNRLTEIQLLIVLGRFEDVDAAAQGYEENINRAVLALAEVARQDGAQTYPILVQIERDLSSYSMTLSELMAFVPGGTQKVLARAIEASQVWSGETN